MDVVHPSRQWAAVDLVRPSPSLYPSLGRCFPGPVTCSSWASSSLLQPCPPLFGHSFLCPMLRLHLLFHRLHLILCMIFLSFQPMTPFLPGAWHICCPVCCWLSAPELPLGLRVGCLIQTDQKIVLNQCSQKFFSPLYREKLTSFFILITQTNSSRRQYSSFNAEFLSMINFVLRTSQSRLLIMLKLHYTQILAVIFSPSISPSDIR